jgi:gluconolactonase
VYDKTGQMIQKIETPEAPANMCFGGKDMKTLFITARTGFYAVRMAVNGVGPQ